jgi:hypothetical protein
MVAMAAATYIGIVKMFDAVAVGGFKSDWHFGLATGEQSRTGHVHV